MNADFIKTQDTSAAFGRNECNPKIDPSSKSGIGEAVKTFCNTKKMRALVFRDSFFEALIPYFSRAFGEVVYIWEYPDLNRVKKMVEIYDPDVVVEQIVERNFY